MVSLQIDGGGFVMAEVPFSIGTSAHFKMHANDFREDKKRRTKIEKAPFGAFFITSGFGRFLFRDFYCNFSVSTALEE